MQNRSFLLSQKNILLDFFVQGVRVTCHMASCIILHERSKDQLSAYTMTEVFPLCSVRKLSETKLVQFVWKQDNEALPTYMKIYIFFELSKMNVPRPGLFTFLSSAINRTTLTGCPLKYLQGGPRKANGIYIWKSLVISP